MNRRTAGEDFYYLQALAQAGRIETVPGTTVRPSARGSWRVPFGTGAAINRYRAGDPRRDRLYHPKSYAVLARWLTLASDAAAQRTPAAHLFDTAHAEHAVLYVFLTQARLEAAWQTIAAPRAAAARRAQFHRWFDALKTVRLLHALRDADLPAQPAEVALREVAIQRGLDCPPCTPQEQVGWLRAHADAGPWGVLRT